MQYVSPAKWPVDKPLKGQLFFVQRLMELSYGYTDQLYKAPAVSIPGLLEEAVSILERRWAEESIARQVSHVLDEIGDRTRQNRALADILHMPITRYLAVDLSDVRSAAVKLKSFRAEIHEESYISSIIERVSSLAWDSKKKEELDYLAEEFVSTLLYMGVSREHIHQTLLDRFFGDVGVNERSLFEFVKAVYPHYHEFKVFASVSESFRDFDDAALGALKIKRLSELPQDDTFTNVVGHESLIKPGHSLYEVEVRSMDYVSAASVARAKIERLASLFQILNHKWTYSTGESFFCQQLCCSTIVKNVVITGNPMHYIKDNSPDKAKSVFAEILRSRTLLRGRDRDKYLNIIELHGVSARMSTPDNQLINMWTCLETMSPGDGSGSNVDKVVNAIVPVLILDHIKSIVITLMLDIFRWDRRKFSKAFSRCKHLTASRTHLRFVEMMSDSRNEAALARLLADMGEFELLRNRLYNVSMMIRSPDKTMSEIDKATKVAKWNLYRIYRMRNNIVHSGSSKPFTKYLVETLHHYFDKSMEFCLELSKRGTRFDSFVLCFAFSDAQRLSYVEKLNSTPHPLDAVWDFRPTKGKGYIFSREESAGRD